MLDEREYFRQWKQIPYEKCPPDVSRKVIQKSGILCHGRSVSSQYNWKWKAYLCADLAIILLITLLVGVDLHKSDLSGQKRLAANTVTLAQKTSHSLQAIILTKEGDEL